MYNRATSSGSSLGYRHRKYFFGIGRYRTAVFAFSHFDVWCFPAHVANQRHIFLLIVHLLHLRFRSRVVVFALIFPFAPFPVGPYAIGNVFLNAEDPVKGVQRSGISLELWVLKGKWGGRVFSLIMHAVSKSFTTDSLDLSL